MSLWGQALRSPVLKLMPSAAYYPLLFPADQAVELLVPSKAPCLSECCHGSHHNDNGQYLQNCKQATN